MPFAGRACKTKFQKKIIKREKKLELYVLFIVIMMDLTITEATMLAVLFAATCRKEKILRHCQCTNN